MRLKPDDLAEIASKVEQLDGLGVDVNEIKMRDHRIILSRQGGTHLIVGITNDMKGTTR